MDEVLAAVIQLYTTLERGTGACREILQLLLFFPCNRGAPVLIAG